jgi:hypothetical protein
MDDNTIVCSDGSESNWGPIRALAATSYQHRDEDGLFVNFLDATPSYCAITLDYRLRCSGPQYPPEVQRQIALLNLENRRSFVPWR